MTGIFLRNSIQQRWIKWPTPDGSKLWIERAIDALWVKVFLSFFGHFILLKFLKNQEAQASVLVSQSQRLHPPQSLSVSRPHSHLVPVLNPTLHQPQQPWPIQQSFVSEGAQSGLHTKQVSQPHFIRTLAKLCWSEVLLPINDTNMSWNVKIPYNNTRASLSHWIWDLQILFLRDILNVQSKPEYVREMDVRQTILAHVNKVVFRSWNAFFTVKKCTSSSLHLCKATRN